MATKASALQCQKGTVVEREASQSKDAILEEDEESQTGIEAAKSEYREADRTSTAVGGTKKEICGDDTARKKTCVAKIHAQADKSVGSLSPASKGETPAAYPKL